MARSLVPLTVFPAVMFLSIAVTITALNYSADTIGKIAAAMPVKTTNLKPSYVVRLPVKKADDLNAAKAVPVVPAAVVPDPPAAIPAAPTYTHTVSVEALRVRSGPKKTFPQVFTLKSGSWVNISDNVRGWVLITDEKGRQGWVYGSLLQPVTQTADATTQ